MEIPKDLHLLATVCVCPSYYISEKCGSVRVVELSVYVCYIENFIVLEPFPICSGGVSHVSVLDCCRVRDTFSGIRDI